MQSLPALSLSSFELPSRRPALATWYAPQKGLSRSEPAAPSADYVEAVSVEVLPAANDPVASGVSRTEAALRLYQTISRNHQPSPVSLHVIV
jgi:hypothetical protein